jgi:endoglycosylceramidase
MFAAPALAASPPGHAGRWITDASGRVLVLHGLNMVYKRPPYLPSAAGFGNDDAAFLSRNGFNVVRLGVIYGAVEPSPGVYDDAYLAGIAATVRALSAHGIYTLLDFHQDQYNERFHGEGFPDWAVQDDGLPNTPDFGFPGNYTQQPAVQRAFDHFWADSPGPGGVGLQERYAAAWGHVAAAFAGDSHVLGYDLFNEPWPGTNWQACLGGCPTFDAQLGGAQRKAITAIRAADPRHLAWYEPNPEFNIGRPTGLPHLGDKRAGMSFHDYCPGGSAAACRGGEQATLKNALARSRATGDALLLTEFGAVADASALRRVASEADAVQMGWIEWAYCGCNDPTGAIPPSNEAVVLDPSKPPTRSNVKTSILRALERPYPQVVAGTPKKFSFDARKRVFKLSYSTRRVGSRRPFRAGSCTAVFVPALQYPHGYRVRVRGAKVVSAPQSGLLELLGRRGPRTATLAVTPAHNAAVHAPSATPACS